MLQMLNTGREMLNLSLTPNPFLQRSPSEKRKGLFKPGYRLTGHWLTDTQLNNHSERKLFTGFAKAALILW